MNADASALEAGWQMQGATLSALGDGHINQTLLAVSSDGRRYVLQRINRTVFENPERVMNNLERVQKHLASMAPDLTPELIPTTSGEPAWIDATGEWWRLWVFVPDGRSLNRSGDPAICRAAGLAFGRFQRLLADLPGPPLEPTIPGFLELGGYLAEFDQMAAGRAGSRSDIEHASVDDEFLEAHRTLADQFPAGPDLIHGDCKLNNLLFDAQGPEVRRILDLDTIMLGHWAWDFGDLARSVFMGADWTDAAGDGGPLTLFAALSEGFLQGSGRTPEPAALALAPTYIAFMLGIRFLTDHLAGDRYFKVSERGENLRRAKEQFELVRKLATLALLETANTVLERNKPAGE